MEGFLSNQAQDARGSPSVYDDEYYDYEAADAWHTRTGEKAKRVVQRLGRSIDVLERTLA